MIQATHRKRLVTFATLLVLGFGGVIYRLVDLQYLRHNHLKVEADKQFQEQIYLPSHRGQILDCNGELLATSSMVYRIVANPQFIGPYAKNVARALAPLLRMKEQELQSRLRLAAPEEPRKLSTTRPLHGEQREQVGTPHASVTDPRSWQRPLSRAP